jgi:N-acetylglutamate synthase-like GNAT family acetyltransferase
MTDVMIHTDDYMTGVIMDQAASTQVQGVHMVRVRRPATSDIEPVREMLSRCSRMSLFHRFHGFTDAAHYFGALLRKGPVDQTFLAWYGSRCVGVASLGGGASGVSDLGVLIEDAWQRRGVGTRLVVSLLADARARGTTTLHADVLGDDLFILQFLRRIGPLTVAIDSGTFSIDIGLSRQPCGSAGT